MNKINMEYLGLTNSFKEEALLYKDLYIGRISSQYKGLYKVITEKGELTAEISGKFRFESKDLSFYPAVGDFIILDRLDNIKGNAIIHAILKRKSIFQRKSAGTSNDIQIIATNIDTIFICMSLNKDFNLRRLERYLSISWDSGAIPVVLLTKSDLCYDLQKKLKEVEDVAIGVEVLVTSSLSQDSLILVKNYISKGKTVAFIGSSGVGKSTLINKLLGDNHLTTNEIRNDDKGKHTTTRRELILLPEGGAVIDTPGMRELGIENADLSKSFFDIDELASKCKFKDCSHKSEPACAVQQAIKDGLLSKERFESYLKLKKEVKYDGLTSREIETEKINSMFASLGGIKNARKYIKNKIANKQGK